MLLIMTFNIPLCLVIVIARTAFNTIFIYKDDLKVDSETAGEPETNEPLNNSTEKEDGCCPKDEDQVDRID